MSVKQNSATEKPLEPIVIHKTKSKGMSDNIAQDPYQMQPGMMQQQPGMMMQQPGQPVMMQPGMQMQPGMMQPGMMQPGM